MRTSTDFERDRDLIVVVGTIIGPAGSVSCRMVLDTGSTITIVTPRIAELAGYPRHDASRPTSVGGPGGRTRGYSATVERLDALGFSCHEEGVNVVEFEDPSRVVHDDLQVEGVLGLSFLDHFNYEIRSYESRIVVERASD